MAVQESRPVYFPLGLRLRECLTRKLSVAAMQRQLRGSQTLRYRILLKAAFTLTQTAVAASELLYCEEQLSWTA